MVSIMNEHAHERTNEETNGAFIRGCFIYQSLKLSYRGRARHDRLADWLAGIDSGFIPFLLNPSATGVLGI